MDRKRPKKPFSLAGSKEPVVRDKDNAAPKIRPPEQSNLHHPRLAPPGMSGIRPTPAMMGAALATRPSGQCWRRVTAARPSGPSSQSPDLRLNAIDERSDLEGV